MRPLQCLFTGLALFALSTAGHAFSLLGPNLPWQTSNPGLNYDPSPAGAPMNLGGEYRWNVPVLTYAFDQSFLEYFGTNGVRAVEGAIKILNDLPPVTKTTPDLNEYLLNTQGGNAQAGALGLIDLKSTTLEMLVRNSGLAEPSRYVWTLRDRTENPTGSTNYLVIMRNFDPVTYTPTNVVNGIATDYIILEGQGPVSDAFELNIAPAVANRLTSAGDFLFGLTRDDVGGLRYIYRPNNYNNEQLLNNIVLSANVTTSPWAPVFSGTNGVPTNLVNQAALINTGIRGGINKFVYRRVNFDSLLGQAFTPRIHRYNERVLSNGIFINQSLQRTIFAPDIVFTAQDLGVDGFSQPFLEQIPAAGNWINNDAINGITVEGGPGVITTGAEFSFSNLGPWFYNFPVPGPGPGGAFLGFAWGSFDDTQIYAIYPEYLNLSVADLESIAFPDPVIP